MPPNTSERPARSLADDLRRRGDRELAVLIRLRPDIAEPVPQNIAELAARASSQPAVRRALDSLDRRGMEVLAVLAAAPQPVVPSSCPVLADSPVELAQVLEQLWLQALLWGARPETADVAVHVASAAREAVPAATETVDLTTCSVSAVATHDPHDIDQLGGQHALSANAVITALAEDWSTRPPAALKSGGLGIRELSTTAVSLRTDEPTAAFWVELGYGAGLIGIEESQARGANQAVRYAPTHAYDLWAQSDLADEWAVLALAWMATDRDADRVGATGADSQRLTALGAGLETPGLPSLRRSVLQVLDALAPGEALDHSQVEVLLEQNLPRVRPELRTRVIASTLREAEQLGLVARGAITTLGRAVLSGAADQLSVAAIAREVMPPATEEFLAQADLTLVVPGPPSPALRALLNLVADLESSGGGAVFRVTPASVARILDTGRPPSEVIEELAARSITPLPQPLEYLINDVARRHGAVRIGAVSSYLRSDDPAVIAAVLSHPLAQSLGIVRVAPTVLVSRSGGEKFVQLARELGHAPVAEGADGSTVVVPPITHRAPDIAHGQPRQRGFDEVFVHALVRALRLAEADSDAPFPVVLGGEPVPRLSMAQSATILREAHISGTPVWIGYADNAGSTTRRLVDVVAIDAGAISAFDHNAGRIRTLAISRVTGVERAEGIAPADKEAPK